MNKEKIYFPNLNGLRCIAAILVIIHHIEQLKSIYGIDNYWGKLKFIAIIGPLGVILFFVLSGFLITYLLLIEEKTTNNINIKKFYIRRILRTWPLYFLIVISALFILPHIQFFTLPGFSKDVVLNDLLLKTALYFTFFANLVLSFFGVVPYAAQTWSIGTEEQFYLVWPAIIKFIKKNRILLMTFVVIIYNIIKEIINSHYLDTIPYKGVFVGFWNGFSIDCMAIGGLFSVLSFYNHSILKIIQNRIFFYITLISTIFLLIIGFNFPLYNNVCYALLFGVIILNFAKTKNIYLSLEHKIFIFLGKISYGLYMYHPIAIVITLKIGLYTNILSNYFFYPLAIMLTIILSSISYNFFEMKFLSLKSKFSNIISGDSVSVK